MIISSAKILHFSAKVGHFVLMLNIELFKKYVKYAQKKNMQYPFSNNDFTQIHEKIVGTKDIFHKIKPI